MSEYLDDASHLERKSELYGICEYVVCSPIPADLANLIVSGLPSDGELSFHDPFYPSPSDPGAYITVRRQDSRYIYCFANHGWHSGWQTQSREFLAQYLALCLPAHCPPDGRGRLSIRPVPPFDVQELLKHRPA